MEDTITMILRIHKRKFICDIETPLDITANDFVKALNQGFDLEIDINNVLECYLKTENPIALIRGNKTLREYGLYDGTIVNII